MLLVSFWIRHIAFFRGFLSFYSSLIPVNLNQNRETVGVFNNRNLPTRKSYDLFSSRLLHKPHSKILVFLLIIVIRSVIYIITAQNVWLVHRPFFKKFIFHHYSFLYPSYLSIFHNYQTQRWYWRKFRFTA